MTIFVIQASCLFRHSTFVRRYFSEFIFDLRLKMVRVVLPPHLRTLAHVDGEVELDLKTPINQRSVLDALEARYPMLRGTIRDHVTHVRRPMVRFFACGEDLSHESAEAPLPDAIARGSEPFLIIGAIAGG